MTCLCVWWRVCASDDVSVHLIGHRSLCHWRYPKRDLLQRQKRPITVSKETYYSVKRGLLQCQKRPITVSKETYYSVKRDLLQCQKRPIIVSKEAYYSVKRDLLQCQKRPITVSKETYYPWSLCHWRYPIGRFRHFIRSLLKKTRLCVQASTCVSKQGKSALMILSERHRSLLTL
jgi:hypothetical protein